MTNKPHDRFFAPLAKPAAGGQQTYWLRQNWGTSTIALCQELLLPKGKYTLRLQSVLFRPVFRAEISRNYTYGRHKAIGMKGKVPNC